MKRKQKQATVGRTPSRCSSRYYQYLQPLSGFLKRTIDPGASPNRVAELQIRSGPVSEILHGSVGAFLGGNWTARQLRDLGGDGHDWGVIGALTGAR